MWTIIISMLFLFISVTLVALEVTAFSPCSHALHSALKHTGTLSSRRSILYAVADPPFSPAEYQEEEEEKQKNDDDSDDEWTPTVGGFFPNFSRRKGIKPEVKPTIEMVDNIHDYKKVVVDEKDRMVVVRFHAAWCKSCKASEPHFKRLAMQHSPRVKFVHVPLTKETAYLQEGLGEFGTVYSSIIHARA